MYSKQFLALDEACAIAERVLAEASRDRDRPVAIAFVDPEGDLVYLARQDGANAHSTMMAMCKAYTAARIRRDTSGLRERYKNWGMTVKDFVDPKYTPVPGGLCIRTSDGTVIGAIGISGRTSEDKIGDVDLGRLGLEALSL